MWSRGQRLGDVHQGWLCWAWVSNVWEYSNDKGSDTGKWIPLQATEQASNQILWALVEAPLSIIRPQYKICPKVAYYTAIIIGYKKWNKPILARQQTRTLVWDDSIIILCLSVQTHLQYNHWCKMKAHLCPNFISSRDFSSSWDERWFRQHLKSSIKLDCPRLSFQSVSNSA